MRPRLRRLLIASLASIPVAGLVAYGIGLNAYGIVVACALAGVLVGPVLGLVTDDERR